MAADFMQLRSAADGQPSAFSYIGQHRYHVTLPAEGDAVFTSAERVTPVLDMLRESARAHAFEVFAYCFLPDQLQIVIRGRRETSDMRGFLTEFRTASSAVVQRALGRALWKKRYLERVLRKGEDVLGVARHVVREPVKRGLVTEAKEYKFLGSFVVDDAVLMEAPGPELAPLPERAPTGFRPPGAPRYGRKFFRGTGKRSGPGQKAPGRSGGGYPPKRHSSGKGGFRPKHADGRSGGWRSGVPGKATPGFRADVGNRSRGPADQPGRSPSRFGNRSSHGSQGKKSGGFHTGSSHGFGRRAGGGGHPGARPGPGGGTRPGFSGGSGRGRFGKRPTSPHGKRGPRKGSRPGGRRSSPGTGTS